MSKEIKWTSKKLRKSFLDFFSSKNHPLIESSSVIPYDDATLLFTNSGMVQFKSRFLNQPSKFSNLKRASSIQRCIRAGGKHNDLKDVGHDTYHHTFFEMMGNWSFGDYGKRKAIEYAWEYLVNILGLEKERLYVTYYVPDVNDRIQSDCEADLESKNIWLDFMPTDRILPFTSENFWEMGNTGPCGPCTEIHYDLVGIKNRSEKVNQDDPSLIEIWNLVFMQYYRDTTGKLTKLNNLSVDTGMGFERLLGILNNSSNYETDLFIPLFEMTNLKYTPDTFIHQLDSSADDHIKQKVKHQIETFESMNDNVALRIIADHARTIAVCLSDNLNFSNEGPGYVLRKITRRMIRVCDEKNITNMIDIIKRASVILELKLTSDRFENIEKECIQFKKTLNRGMKYFNSSDQVTTTDIYKLSDTYGFPFDLTIQLCKQKGIYIDEEKLEKLVEQGIRKSKQENSNQQFDEHFIKKSELLNKIDMEKTIWLDQDEISCSKLHLMDKNFKIVENLEDGNKCFVVTDKTNITPFSKTRSSDKGQIIFYENNQIVGIIDIHKSECLKLKEKNDISQIKNNSSSLKTIVLHEGLFSGRRSVTIRIRVNSQIKKSIRDNGKICEIFIKYLQCKIKRYFYDENIIKLEYESTGQMTIDTIQKLEDEVNLEIKSTKISNDLYFKILSNDNAGSGIRKITCITGEQAKKYNERGQNINVHSQHELCLLDRMKMMQIQNEQKKASILKNKKNIRERKDFIKNKIIDILNNKQKLIIIESNNNKKEVMSDVHGLYNGIIKDISDSLIFWQYQNEKNAKKYSFHFLGRETWKNSLKMNLEINNFVLKDGKIIGDVFIDDISDLKKFK